MHERSVPCLFWWLAGLVTKGKIEDFFYVQGLSLVRLCMCACERERENKLMIGEHKAKSKKQKSDSSEISMRLIVPVHIRLYSYRLYEVIQGILLDSWYS